MLCVLPHAPRPDPRAKSPLPRLPAAPPPGGDGAAPPQRPKAAQARPFATDMTAREYMAMQAELDQKLLGLCTEKDLVRCKPQPHREQTHASSDVFGMQGRRGWAQL